MCKEGQGKGPWTRAGVYGGEKRRSSRRMEEEWRDEGLMGRKQEWVLGEYRWRGTHDRKGAGLRRARYWVTPQKGPKSGVRRGMSPKVGRTGAWGEMRWGGPVPGMFRRNQRSRRDGADKPKR